MPQPNLAAVPDETSQDVETLTCFAGHEWQAPRSQGAKQQSCPAHKRFTTEALPKRLCPSPLTLREWSWAADQLEDDEYMRRWRRAWEKLIRELGARNNSFSGIDPEPVAKYIQHARLAELHRLNAAMAPYITSKDTGMVRQHPGFEAARREEWQAREAFKLIGLPQDNEQGGQDERDDSTFNAGGDEVIDDQLGPDGEPL